MTAFAVTVVLVVLAVCCLSGRRWRSSRCAGCAASPGVAGAGVGVAVACAAGDVVIELVAPAPGMFP